MSINFTTLQSLTIPEGVVTQITDAVGNVIWELSNEPIVLEVAKQTLTTYAGETSYAAESFVLLDIYPKNASSTVKVTYGGLTKTLTFSGTNAQQVHFGTFNGVLDSVETPTSGTLTIEGGCSGFACGVYQSGSKTTNKGYCSCITAVSEWGDTEYIVGYAFYNCSSLELASLPSGVTGIGDYAFYECTSLTLTELPSGITSIGTYAFYNCSGITLSELPSGITSISDYAFHGCTNIAFGELPSGITSVGRYAFYECKNLALASLPSGITSVGQYAFYNCSGITLTSLPSGITSIGDYIFSGCIGFTRLTIPDGVTSIGVGTFSNCSGLESLTISDSVTSIGANAFYCAFVEDNTFNDDVYPITIGSGIQTIGSGAFSYLGDDYILTMRAATPPTISSDTLEGGLSTPRQIIVPEGCGNVYKNAENWSTYANQILEAS